MNRPPATKGYSTLFHSKDKDRSSSRYCGNEEKARVARQGNIPAARASTGDCGFRGRLSITRVQRTRNAEDILNVVAACTQRSQLYAQDLNSLSARFCSLWQAAKRQIPRSARDDTAVQCKSKVPPGSTATNVTLDP
jgi:hypothetical protein